MVDTRNIFLFLLFVISSTATIAQDFQVDDRVALPFSPSISFESQCGLVDDLQHVESYDGRLGVDQKYVATQEPSTVQLQWLDESSIRARLPDHAAGNIANERWCTGTLVSDRHVLTAGHCFDIQDGRLGWTSPFKTGSNRKPIFASPDILATLQVVNFNYQRNASTGKNRVPDVYPILKLVEYRRGKLDYALIEVGRNRQDKRPGEIYKPAVVDTRKAIKGETLAMIQHPHGDPKKIEAGNVLLEDDIVLYYNNIDTHGGSSGAGGRDKEGRIIAVHTNGGCATDSKKGANKGTSTNAIAKVSDVLK